MSNDRCYEAHSRRRPWRHESQFAEELTRWVTGIVDRVVDAIVDIDDRARTFAERWRDGGDADGEERDRTRPDGDDARGYDAPAEFPR